jgi:hypothetical protein
MHLVKYRLYMLSICMEEYDLCDVPAALKAMGKPADRLRETKHRIFSA